MAMTQQRRDQKRREKELKTGAEELRLKALAGEKQMIKDIMEWTADKEQASAVMFCIRRMHSLGPEGARLAQKELTALHKKDIPESWCARFVEESRREALRNPGDEILLPVTHVKHPSVPVTQA